MDIVNLADLDAIEKVTTGYKLLDLMLGGGLPRGIIEIYGRESSGKSMLVANWCGNHLRTGLHVIWYDQEDSFEQNRDHMGRQFGLNFDDYTTRKTKTVDRKKIQIVDDINSPFVLAHADFGEEMFDHMIETAAAKRKAGVAGRIFVVTDSLAHTLTEAEFKRSFADKEFASMAGLLARSLKKLTDGIRRYDLTWLIINQVREKIGVMFGDKEKTTGGNAVLFSFMVRLKLTRMQRYEGGYWVKLFGKKNKVAIPGTQLMIPYTFAEGFDEVAAAEEILCKCNRARRNRGDLVLRKRADDEEFTVKFPKPYKFSHQQALIKLACAEYLKTGGLPAKTAEE